MGCEYPINESLPVFQLSGIFTGQLNRVWTEQLRPYPHKVDELFGAKGLDSKYGEDKGSLR